MSLLNRLMHLAAAFLYLTALIFCAIVITRSTNNSQVLVFGSASVLMACSCAIHAILFFKK